MTAIPGPADGTLRRVAVRTLFGGVALGTTGFYVAMTAAPLLADEITGSATWSGVPSATGIVGTALGALLVSAATGRLDRRAGLTAGYAVGIVGAGVVVAATVAASFALVLTGMLLLGVGHSANQLTRYAAADLSDAAKRASTLSWMVWAGTIGAVAGPNLLAPAGAAARLAGLPVLGGGYLVVVVFFAAPIVLYRALLRTPPSDRVGPPGDGDRPAASLSRLLRLPRVRAAATAMIVGQAVMVLIMTMTPLHLRHAGHGLAGIGLVLGAHTFGMFGLAPVAGRLADRVGNVAVILAGQVLLAVAAVTAAVVPPRNMPSLAAALFLLGLGWSFGLVAGSSLLTSGLTPAAAVRVQGPTETLIWSTSAAASLSSGLLLARGGFAVLSLSGLLLIVVAVTVVGTHRRHLRVTAPAPDAIAVAAALAD